MQYCSGCQKLSFFFSGEEVTLARLFAGIKMTSGTQGSGIPEMFAIPQLISSSLNPKPTV